MVKLTVKYEDFDGQEVEETLSFHLNEQEVGDIDGQYELGLKGTIDELQKNENVRGMLAVIQDVIIKAYGVRKGKAFVKNQDVIDEFQYSPALLAVTMNLLEDESGKRISNFLLNCMPNSAKANVIEQAKKDPELAKLL